MNHEWHLSNADALEVYRDWPRPNTIISDGAYGVGGFPGDPRTPAGLAEWYKPHIEEWSRRAKLNTTLWFWNTEVGWANVHPLLEQSGWTYEFTNIWNKGIGQVAGNVNSKTIRRFPVVTEVCVFYTRTPLISSATAGGATVHMKEWILSEWKRTGLPRRLANEACGVKDAATRKYFDQGWLWYFPPTEQMMKIVAYANEHGDPNGRPYYSLNGSDPVSDQEWSEMRSPWHHEHGVTNVWDRPSLRGKERYRGSMQRSAPRTYKPTAMSASHLNQKPLDLMRRIVSASTNPGDTVWEPFGGLCSGSVAACELGRIPWAAEIDPGFYEIASERLQSLDFRLL
ncbi:site-specific DNA-methyltransferase (adenine-specific) [Arcanobacterium wilhelmae]|uniref:Methyltransferase n=2 Tax=Actinomycetaceae TaxID=2049 RepID=A0ABT9N8Q4_9ACTO|nr:DNA methyltransferase [Arcanobacterium wilhelmae]MDP9800083.1 site-specific DNA-methyltransferase (adenine-specific) [Arcanobacterium wilhelmae]